MSALRPRWMPWGLALCLAWWAGSSTAAADLSSTAGKTMQLGAGARAAGMGEALAAAAEDVYALYWNPAALDRLRVMELGYMHNFWLGGIQQSCLGYGQPIRSGTVGLSVMLINYGTIDRYESDVSGYPVPGDGTFNPLSTLVAAGYGWGLSGSVSVGGALKLLAESLGDTTAMTLAADVGTLWQDLLPGLDTGCVLQNLGLPLEGYSLPVVLRAGAAYRLPWLMDPSADRWLVALDAVVPYPQEQPGYVNAGLEYRYAGTFSGRLGYRFGPLNGLGEGAGLTAGIGLTYAGITLDYAFVPLGDLGSTHRVSLQAAFPSAPSRVAATAPIVSADAPLPEPVTEGDRAVGASLTPTLSSLSLRKQLQLRFVVRVQPEDPTRVDRAVFRLVTEGGRRVRRWGLQILDPAGRTVYGVSGEDQPDHILWSGQDREGDKPRESVFFTYAFEALMDDGAIESLKGDLQSGMRSASTETASEDRQPLPVIVFEEGSADLTEPAVNGLRDAAAKLQRKPYLMLQIEGHTDDRTEETQAFLLSRKRADSVARYLAATFAIPVKSMVVNGRGSRNPAASNATAEGRQQNRRVELTIVYKR